MEEVVKYLRALIALQLRSEREEGVPAQKIELVLAGLGFTAREISELSGKNQAAVAKAISRGKAAFRTAVSQQPKEVSSDE